MVNEQTKNEKKKRRKKNEVSEQLLISFICYWSSSSSIRVRCHQHFILFEVVMVVASQTTQNTRDYPLCVLFLNEWKEEKKKREKDDDESDHIHSPSLDKLIDLFPFSILFLLLLFLFPFFTFWKSSTWRRFCLVVDDKRLWLYNRFEFDMLSAIFCFVFR